MTEGMDRLGLSEAEAALLWAAAQFGGGQELMGGLEPAAAEALGPRAQRLRSMAAPGRAALAEEWRAEDERGEDVQGAMARVSLSRQRRLIPTLGERWSVVAARAVEGEAHALADDGVGEVAARIALDPLLRGPHRLRMELVGSPGSGPFDVGWLLRQDRSVTQLALLRIGVAMTARVVAPWPRRQQARFVGALEERAQRWMIEELREERAVEEEVVERAREVLVRAQRGGGAWEDTFEVVGMYFVVCAGSRRHGKRLRRWMQRCGAERAQKIGSTWTAHARGSHPWLDAPTQRALDGMSETLRRDVFAQAGGE